MKTRFFQIDNGRYWKDEKDLPALSSGEILIKTIKSLVSVGTETAIASGKASVKTWAAAGYCNIGRIVEANQPFNGFQTGMRVAGLKPHTDYYIANSRDSLYMVPDGVRDEDASYFVLATVGLRAVERAALAVGQTVVVVGQGTVGQLAAQIARIAGAGKVIAVDLDQGRLDLSKKLGADFAICPDLEEFKKALSASVKDSPAPVFIEVTGAVRALEWIISAAPLRSRIVLTGTFCQNITFDPFVFIDKELDMVGAHQPKTPSRANECYPYSKSYNYHLVFDWIRRGRLKTKELCDKMIRPDELLEFYDAVRDQKPHAYQPIIDWEGGSL